MSLILLKNIQKHLRAFYVKNLDSTINKIVFSNIKLFQLFTDIVKHFGKP